MDATGSFASIIDAHAAESTIHSGSSSCCIRPSRSTVTWRTASDLFAFERTTRVVLPCQGCHRYETITSAPWAFRRALVPQLPHTSLARKGFAGAKAGGAARPRDNRGDPIGRRTPSSVHATGRLTSCPLGMPNNQEPHVPCSRSAPFGAPRPSRQTNRALRLLRKRRMECRVARGNFTLRPSQNRT